MTLQVVSFSGARFPSWSQSVEASVVLSVLGEDVEQRLTQARSGWQQAVFVEKIVRPTYLHSAGGNNPGNPSK